MVREYISVVDCAKIAATLQAANLIDADEAVKRALALCEAAEKAINKIPGVEEANL